MFGPRFQLFRIFGIPIRIDASWFIIALLVTWSLATGVFPQQHAGLAASTYWLMGAVGALGLFASVVLHELSHALVARHQGLTMGGITLFIFGGVAEMTDEPASPRAEFLIAVAGPVASVLVAAGCYLARLAADWPLAADAVLAYLALINGILVLFNLIPGFPLDGGRILRSALWQWRGSLRWATRVAARIGAGFGLALIFLGILVVVMPGGTMGGLWWVLIGLFLRNAAQMGYQQLLLRQSLEGEPVRRFMQSEPVTVPRAISVRELVEDYIYRHHHKMFPVVDDGRLLGCVSTQEVKRLPVAEWERQSVGAVAQPCSGDNTIGPDDDAMAALGTMSRLKVSRLMVVEGERLVGILSLKDLLKFLSLKVELEEA